MSGRRPDEGVIPAPVKALGSGPGEIRPVSAQEVRMRETAEAKALPQALRLVDLLAHLPSEWVGAVHRALGLDVAGDSLRPGVQRARIAEHLGNPEQLAARVGCLPDQAKSLLRELLERGPSHYPSVVERWGIDHGDGFFWNERLPSAPLSWLRRMGLAYVGMRAAKPLIVVPEDLAAPLKALLGKG